jgi:hypothetical protein
MRAEKWTKETAPKGTGGHAKKLVFSYADIAKIKGVTVYSVRRAVSRGSLDPLSLESICSYISTKRKPKMKGVS